MNESVLILDDSLTVRMDLAEAFEAAGFLALPCATIAKARETLAREPVDVAILDVLLPDGNGVDLLREIRALDGTAAITVLMLSSESDVKDRIKGLQTGADEYVGKPYDAGYVVAKARQFLRARRGEVAADRPAILIIDDSITFREALRQAFSDAGYSVVVAASGEEGLRLAASRHLSAIVVDGMLPGMDGAAVIRHVRLDAALRRVPCLLLTASEDRGAELRALDAGADAFVRKDEDIEVVLAKLAAALRGSTLTKAEDTASLLGPKRILAVDDSPTYLQEMSATLRGEGYDVVLAQSGEEALELLAVQTVDCILLDLLMPGIGGQEACRRIKAAPIVRDIPLIMLTALEDRDVMLESLGAGADDYISKSSEFEVLKARVRAQIRRKQFEDESRRLREQLLRKELESERARAAQKLAEARAILVEELKQKNDELEAFSYSVSHDLRAPLRTIDGFTHMLAEDYGAGMDEEGRRLIGVIRGGAARMSELIDDLLEFARLGRKPLVMAPVEMKALAREVANELASIYPETSVELGDLPTVYGDPALLRQVWANLVGNAFKYSAQSSSPKVEIGGSEQNEETIFWVRDNGAGFDMRYYEKLFKVFQRLHGAEEFEGTGVGLAIVQRIVSRHGGRVWGESVVGSGACFHFTLPNKLGRLESLPP
jgi:two-component system NtrC family sensor kinase